MLTKTMTMALFACVACSALGPVPSVAASPPSQEPGASAVEPIKTVELKFLAFNRHDAAAIEALYASDAMLRSPDNPELVGNVKIADTYRWIFDAIPDARDSVDSIESIGSRVYVQFIMSGHLKAAGNKPVSVRIMSVYTVKDQRIANDATYYDRKAP